MHFSINITNITYDGDNYITYDATLIRSDNVSNVLNIISQVENIQEPLLHDFDNQNVIYQRIAETCYNLFCVNFSLSQDVVSYIFLGLSITGPFKLTYPKFVKI